MENYMEWKQMGVQKRMKPHVVPHKFTCQPDRKRTVTSSTSNVLLKRAKLELVQDALRNILSTWNNILQTEDAQSVVHQQKQIESEEETNKFASVEVQVNIRLKYRSKLIQCSLSTAIVCKSCSPLNLSTTSIAVSPFKFSNIARNIYTSSESNSSSESPVGSNKKGAGQVFS